MKTKFEVENIKCNGCVNTIEKEVSSLDGISNVSVDLTTKILTFESDDNLVNNVELKLQEIGHPKKEPTDILSKAKAYLNNQ